MKKTQDLFIEEPRTFTVLQTGDWHHDETNAEETIPALVWLIKQVSERKPDLVVLPGDLTMSRGHLTPTQSWRIRETVEAMARTCPVVIIPGNHDISHAWEKVDNLKGIFTSHSLVNSHSIHVMSQPGIIEVGPLALVCLPFPSKYVLLSQDETQVKSTQELNALMSAKLSEALMGLGAQLETRLSEADKLIPVLVFHGVISGFKEGTETMMLTGETLVLKESDIPASIRYVMAGHLHEAQTRLTPETGGVHRAIVYPGSPAPLTFTQEAQVPQVAWWKFNLESGHSTLSLLPVPVAHPHLTLDLGQVDNPTLQRLQDAVTMVLGDRLLVGARVRVRFSVSRAQAGLAQDRGLKQWLEGKGAHRVLIFKTLTQETADLKPEIVGKESTDELMELWAHEAGEEFTRKLQTEPQLLEKLKDTAKEIDTALQSKNTDAFRGTVYEPRKIWWSNWKQHQAGELDFGSMGRLVCITGENASGKSNVAEVEAFALWKHTIKGETLLKDVVRIGAESCEVGIEFEAGGEVYRVVRTVFLKGDAADSDLLLSKRLPDEPVFKSMNLGTQGKTQKFLETLVGSVDLYLATRFSSQRDIDKILQMKPSELKDTLQAALNLKVFELRHSLAKERLVAISLEMDKLGARVEVETRAASELEHHLDVLHTMQEQLCKLELQEGHADAKVKELQIQASSLKEQLAKRQPLNEEKARTNQRLVETRSWLRNSQLGIERLMKMLESRGEIEKGVEELRTTRAALAKATQVQNTISQLEREHQGKQRSLEAKKSTLMSQLATLRETIRQCDRRVAVKENPNLNCVDLSQARCGFLKDSLEAAEQLPSLQTELQGLQDEQLLVQKQLEREMVELQDSMVKVWQESQLSGDGRDQDVSRRLRRLLDNAHENIKVLERQDLEHQLEQLTRAEVELENHKTRLKQDKQTEAELEESILTIQEQLSRFDVLALQLGPLEREVSQQESILLAIRNDRASTERNLGAMQNAVSTAQAARSRLEELNRDLIIETIHSMVLSEYIRAVSRDGLPYYILQRALPTFESYANEFLGENGLRLLVEPLKELQDGEVKTDPVLRFQDEKGIHPIQEASGFQGYALGYSARASMARIQAERLGLTVTLASFDEGWGAYDDKNILQARTMLRALAATFNRVVFITHVATVREIAETVVTVIPDAVSGATISVDSRGGESGA